MGAMQSNWVNPVMQNTASDLANWRPIFIYFFTCTDTPR